MEKLRRVLSGQDDEEQGLTAQVTSSAAATAGGRPRTAVGESFPDPRGRSVPAALPWPFSAPSPPAPKSRSPCSGQASGPGCLWPAHAFQVSRLRSGRETGEHGHEATPCRRPPVKSALLSNAGDVLLTEPLLFACDPDVRLDKDLLPPVRI